MNLTRARRLAQVTDDGDPASADPAILLLQVQRLLDLNLHEPCEVYAATHLPAKRFTTDRAAPHVTRRMEILRLAARAR